MTELERKALLGDYDSQQKCSNEGIVLSCPFCGCKPHIRREGNGYVMLCASCGAKGPKATIRKWHRNKFIAQSQAKSLWNMRTDAPIGRCAECKHWDREGIMAISGYNIAKCGMWSNPEVEDNTFSEQEDFCSYFEDKESETND